MYSPLDEWMLVIAELLLPPPIFAEVIVYILPHLPVDISWRGNHQILETN